MARSNRGESSKRLAFGGGDVTTIAESDSLEVDVYKTARRPQTFLFVPRDLPPGEWPEDLFALFREPEKVLTLTLTPERALAAQSATVVMDAVRTRGFFLQMPPDPQVGRRE